MNQRTLGPDAPMDGSKHPSCGRCAYRFGQVWLCPLHAAAPEMKVLLSAIIESADQRAVVKATQDARALLAKIDS